MKGFIFVVVLILHGILGAAFSWLLRIGYKEKTGKEPSIKRFLFYFFIGCIVAISLFNGTILLLHALGVF